jgi:DNA primase
MSQAEKVRILRDVLGDCRKSGDEYLFYCPQSDCNHNKRKLSINISKNAFKCWICNWAGNSIYYVVKDFGTDSHKNKWRTYENNVDLSSFIDDLFPETKSLNSLTQKVPLPDEFVTLTSKKLPKNLQIAMNYLKSRGITRQDVIQWKIGACPYGEEYGQRIIIPSFGMTGYTNYFVGRKYTQHYWKYQNAEAPKNIVFNHLYVDWDEPITLVEGAFDAIKAGWNSIPILGSTLKENSLLFAELVRHECTVYIALDPDAKKKQTSLINKLLSYDLEVYDVNVPEGLDVGDMKKEDYKILEKLAKRIDYSNNFEYNVYCQFKEMGL